MRVLFIGGTGIISSACSRLALDQGIELYLLNRGTSHRETPKGAKTLHGNIRDDTAEQALKGLTFDAVVDWIAFTEEHIERDIQLFEGKTRQFVFISSASAYQTPPSSLPVTEATMLENPFWEYSRNKIKCEELLTNAYRKGKFPSTVIRPSHTYDKTLLPFDHGWTVVDRMRKNKPIIVHGDGTSLWTLTHHKDFAKGFVPLLGNCHALGETFHITSDYWLSWNQIFDIVASAAGTKAIKVHVPSDEIARIDADWGASLLGDKAHSMIFDNSKLKRLVPDYAARIPFTRGAEEMIAWYDADPARQMVDENANRLEDLLLEKFGGA